MNELQYWQAAGIVKAIERHDGYAVVETDHGFHSVGTVDINSIGGFRLETVGDEELYINYLKLRYGDPELRKRVRRRVEDALRKSHEVYALALAAFATGIKVE